MSKWLVTINTSEYQSSFIYQFKGELPTETEIRSYISKKWGDYSFYAEVAGG